MNHDHLSDLAIGAHVSLTGMRRCSSTEGKVVAYLRNGWVVVDFPSWCWIGEPAKLELLDESVAKMDGRR
jgi:hypothetical protein